METLYNPETERLDEINERLSLIQSRSGLTFGTDSYLLAAYAKEAKNGICAELGSGTGVVSLLAAAREKYAHIHAFELQPYFALLTERNAEMNSLSDKISAHCADVREVKSSDTGGEVHVVLSNPPYMRSGSGKNNASEEMNIARREENGTIRDFTDCAARLLRWGGCFDVVYRPDRLSELLVAMSESGLEPKRMTLIYPSLDDRPCLVLAEGKKGGSPGISVTRPLIIYEDKQKSVYTDDMRKIYDTFSFEHLENK